MTTGESGCFPRGRARSRLKGRDPYRVPGVHSMYAAHPRIKRFAFAPGHIARLGKIAAIIQFTGQLHDGTLVG